MRSARSHSAAATISVCTTNYNCAHALRAHLESIERAFTGEPFEYVVVDNYSRDASWSILEDWVRVHPSASVIRRSCTMGTGRNLAVASSTAPYVLIVDTDVVYRPEIRDFAVRARAELPRMAVQAPFAGLFPRELWEAVRGRRSLNTYEDVDMWMRLHALGRMRWYPVLMGENMKETYAEGGFDHFSRRYPKWERAVRLLRREWDLWKTRGYEGIDLEAIVRANSVDLRLGTSLGSWVGNRPRCGPVERAHVMGRILFQVLRS